MIVRHQTALKRLKLLYKRATNPADRRAIAYAIEELHDWWITASDEQRNLAARDL